MGAEHPSGGCFSNCPTCRALRLAAAEVAVRDGVDETTGAAVAARAGVSREEASRHYPMLDDCLAAAYDEGTMRLRRACVRALRGEGAWADRLHAAVDAAIDEFRDEPELARFCVVEAWRSDIVTLRASRMAMRERFVEILTEEAGPDAEDAELPELRFELLAGAAHHVVSTVLTGDGDGTGVRRRLDEVIGMFEPEREPVARATP
jgi:AcrR family transcriptional regulator